MFNMKKMKKPLVLLLTLIMVLSMSATAFAAEATVNFYNGDKLLWTTKTGDLTAENIDRSYYDLQKYPEATNPCNGQPSVMDALIAAMGKINETQPENERLSHHIDWAPAVTDPVTGSADGFYMDDIYVGDPNSGDNDYITQNEFTPGTPNISEGYGWNGYYVGADGKDVSFSHYLSNEELTNNMTINFKYEYYYFEW